MATMMVDVPAIRGRMGNTECYTANFPFGIAVKLFQFDPDRMPERVEDRYQRQLSRERVGPIAAYLLEHEDYVFASIVVSVDVAQLRFRPLAESPDVGVLSAPLEAEWIVNDGQHRLAGIARALQKDQSLRDHTISVVILPDPDLRRCQQIFSDLNRTAKRTSASLDIAFDHRSPLNRLTNIVVDQVPLFRGHTDKEKVSLSQRSSAFTTLSAVGAAHRQLFGALSDEAMLEEELALLIEQAVGFWSHLTDIVEPWSRIVGQSLPAPVARQDYVSSYAIALWALAAAGRAAFDETADWHDLLAKLADVDWRKSNNEWQGICLQGGEVVTRQPTRLATAGFLKWKMDLGPRPLPVLELGRTGEE